MLELINFSLDSCGLYGELFLIHHIMDRCEHFSGQRVSGLQTIIIVGILGTGASIYKIYTLQVSTEYSND